MDILKKINDLRQEKGWTIYKLSEESGIPQSTLSNMFTRKTMPSLATLKQLCDAFNITLAEFFNENNDLPNDDLYLLSQFRMLSDKEKTIVKDLISIMIKEEKN